jgi:hypothetical protein
MSSATTSGPLAVVPAASAPIAFEAKADLKQLKGKLLAAQMCTALPLTLNDTVLLQMLTSCCGRWSVPTLPKA